MFSYSVENAFVTDMRSSGHNNSVPRTSHVSYKLNNHHLKSMHFSGRKPPHTILHFPAKGNTLDHPVYVNCI